jgi:hypothetical protein
MRSGICCPSGLSWSCRMTSARTSLGGDQDPMEIPTRRWSERVSEASRILPEHRGASVSAAWPPASCRTSLDRPEVESEGRAVTLCLRQIALVVFLEVVIGSSANRSYRREGQEAALDDLQYQDQVGLPSAEVGCCLEYLLDNRNRHGQCHSEEEAAGHSDTVPL